MCLNPIISSTSGFQWFGQACAIPLVHSFSLIFQLIQTPVAVYIHTLCRDTSFNRSEDTVSCVIVSSSSLYNLQISEIIWWLCSVRYRVGIGRLILGCNKQCIISLLRSPFSKQPHDPSVFNAFVSLSNFSRKRIPSFCWSFCLTIFLLHSSLILALATYLNKVSFCLPDIGPGFSNYIWQQL